MTADDADVDPRRGWVAPAVRDEFPGLTLWWLPVDVQDGKSPPGLQERLKHLSGRLRGAQAMQLRSQPIPHAYRVFFRHIGLDPDVDRVPIEAIVVDRLMYGAYQSRSLLADALRLACVETQVAVWAVDADRLSGELRVRGAYDREELDAADPHVPPLREGKLVVADDAGPVAVLFSEPVRTRAVNLTTRRTVLFSLQVEGVPTLAVTEALWTVFDILEDAQGVP